MIITRFAPSPTGFLHIGSARTALFSWAYAKKYHGKFILRIEDTDLERSTQDSVDSIIHAMEWLHLNYDEGPYYQTKRQKRYQEVLAQLLENGDAYYCYCSKERLEQLRDKQMANGEKPRYDRYCLHHKNNSNSALPPVVRFRNPDSGDVIWDDLVKGTIRFSNDELDDLIIARSNGSPTYNFCVVIDDLDMKITHVTRGDDHVNNTPRQINILRALNAPIPYYAHLPMILAEDGHKMSKRRDPVKVMDYQAMGILPTALMNYLARLCWAHGNDEIFSIEQFIEWFDLKDISPSPARFDMKKLLWVNSQHIRQMPSSQLKQLLVPRFIERRIDIDSLSLTAILDVVKLRHDNLNDIVEECICFYKPKQATPEELEMILTSDAKMILASFCNELNKISFWDQSELAILIKKFCTDNGIKTQVLGMPLRLKLCGTTKAPSLDQIIFLLGKQNTLDRLAI